MKSLKKPQVHLIVNRALIGAVVASLACAVFTPKTSDAQRRRKLPVQAKSASLLKISKADLAAAETLRKGLSAKQNAALQRLGLVMLQDARQAAKQGKRKYSIISKRTRPHVLAVGSKNVSALATAAMLSAAKQADEQSGALRIRVGKYHKDLLARQAQIATLRKSKHPDLALLATRENQVQKAKSRWEETRKAFEQANETLKALYILRENILQAQQDMIGLGTGKKSGL